MRNSLDYAGLAQLCARSPIMRKIMRVHNRIIQPSLVMSIHFGTASTYPCCIFDIVSKRDQTNDIHLSGLSTYAVSIWIGLTVIST